MKKTVHKIFLLWNFDQEEKWLNYMSRQGWHLCDVGYCRYVFEQGESGKYIIRLELLDHLPSHPESKQYIRFLEETGAEHIGSLMRWVYFRQKAAAGNFHLFSDIASRIRHLNRIVLLAGVFALINLASSFYQLSIWLAAGQTLTLISFIFCLMACLLLTYGYFRLNRKKRKLLKEHLLYE